ncbi:MAG: hypothetical protein ACD_39C02056G0001 [uncultured bacterium]|nr:MAG: hypothetical protein ACD_39C02056G0001 [uncultured bacterium]
MSDILSKFYLVYQNYTGIPEYGGSKYFVFIAWSIESFQYNFLVQELEKINQMIKPGRLIVRLKDSSRILPEGAGNYSNLDWLLRKADTSKFSLNDSLTVGNEKFVAVAMPGLNFESASLAYIYPRQLLEKKVDAIRRNLVASVLLFLLVLIVFAWKFAKHQVKPVELLEHGLKSIARRDFNCQLDFHSSDEFGDLIQTFNSAIENMKDLEVARSVQESLLPPSDFSTDKLEIYVKTQFMTSMGGDYFDIAAGNGKVYIAFGDVAGHGIPAALVMAMIKAVFSDCIESGDEKTFLESCNKIMLYLRNKGWKRMMTLQFIVIDESSNEFSIVNAGHCFPVKIDADKKKVSFIKARGIPLGYVLTKNYTVVNDVLNPGETLVLYSDGLIEGTCATGEMFGFDRFESLLLETVSDSSPIMWQKIVSAVTNWCVEQSDDLSTMIVRMK